MEKGHKEKKDRIIGKRFKGRRKRAVAVVMFFPIPVEKRDKLNMWWLSIENEDAHLYFQHNENLIQIVDKPINLLKIRPEYFVVARVFGGGLKSQAEAIQLAVARELCEINPAYRPILKENGCLTCDSRIKERKKYGLKKSREASQFSKR